MKSLKIFQIDYIKYSLLMFAGIVLIFISAKLVGLEHAGELRFLNIIVVAILSARMAKGFTKKKSEYDWLRGYFHIMIANCLAILYSIIGFVVYATFIDPSFVEYFSGWVLFGGATSVVMIAGSIAMEGAAGAIIVTLAVMNYYQYKKQPTEVTKNWQG